MKTINDTTKMTTFDFYEMMLPWPSVLWHCWLGSRKGNRPVKTEWWGAGVVTCLERGADLHMVQLMPLLLTVSCFSKIQIGFTFLVPAYPGSPGKRSLNGCECVFLMYVEPWTMASDENGRYCHYCCRHSRIFTVGIILSAFTAIQLTRSTITLLNCWLIVLFVRFHDCQLVLFSYVCSIVFLFFVPLLYSLS